jgi:hypothetical protein
MLAGHQVWVNVHIIGGITLRRRRLLLLRLLRLLLLRLLRLPCAGLPMKAV